MNYHYYICNEGHLHCYDLYFESIGEVVPGCFQLAAQSLDGHSLDASRGGADLVLLEPVQHDDPLSGHLLQLTTELVVIVTVPLGRRQEVILVVLVEQPHEGGELPGGVGGVHGEDVHVLLDVEPGVHLDVVGAPQLTGEILGVNVVEQLGELTQVENIKVQQVVAVHQLTQHWLPYKIVFVVS